MGNTIFVTHALKNSIASGFQRTPEERKIKMVCNVQYLCLFIFIQTGYINDIYFTNRQSMRHFLKIIH